jgi:hypothetical protein
VDAPVAEVADEQRIAEDSQAARSLHEAPRRVQPVVRHEPLPEPALQPQRRSGLSAAHRDEPQVVTAGSR